MFGSEQSARVVDTRSASPTLEASAPSCVTIDPSDRLNPTTWPWALSESPVLSSEATRWRKALLRRWTGTSCVMVQPPLDHHYVVLHLGGAKHVERRRDGPTVSRVADRGSFTVVPAGTAFDWRTTGPIDFAHLYVRPEQLDGLAADTRRGGWDGSGLTAQVAVRDPVLEALFTQMLREIEQGSTASTIRLDCLFDSLMVRLASRFGSHEPVNSRKAVVLAPFRLRRALDYIETHVGDDIALEDLVEAAGSSQFHFSHAFKSATGVSPYRYLIDRRIELAKVLLVTGHASLEAVGRQCGFNSRHQFGVMFKRVVGVGPKHYRVVHAATRPIAAKEHDDVNADEDSRSDATTLRAPTPTRRGERGP